MKNIIFTVISVGLMFFFYFCLCRYSHYKQIAEKHLCEIDKDYRFNRLTHKDKFETLRAIVILGALALTFFLLKAGLEVLVYGKC
jgi:hypothetical protein